MHISLATQIISFIGAMMILVAYVGHQFGWMNLRRPLYKLLNAVGSGILAWIALRPLQLGFAILELVWVAVSVVALLRTVRTVSMEGRHG